MNISLETNRDLYKAIDQLSEKYKNDNRTLEHYLLAILNRASTFANCESLSLAEFYSLIEAGFTHEPLIFDDKWRQQYEKLPTKDTGYAGWQAFLIQQIVDLREMDECGSLQDEMRYFGITSPRGPVWYNFTPAGYLECAMAGSFDGWDPEDESNRVYVPGMVAVYAEDGSVQSVKPEDLPHPVNEIANVTWESLIDFIICGREYE